jgi:hypothetical protein
VDRRQSTRTHRCVPNGGNHELKHFFSPGQREAISFAQNIVARPILSYFCSPH